MSETTGRGVADSTRLPIRPFQEIPSPFLAFETMDYLAFFKPAGMHSVPAASSADATPGEPPGRDFVSWVRAEFSDHAGIFEGADERASGLGKKKRSEMGMLSRLDRETSGLILFARSEEAFERALGAQGRGGIRKFYRLAVSKSGDGLAGSWPRRWAHPKGDSFIDRLCADSGTPPTILIESYFRSYGARGARVACVSAELAAKTKKKLTSELYATSVYPLPKRAGELSTIPPGTMEIEACIRSGFRHQIRAHLAWSGYPIAGDRLYGGIGALRLYLESHRIELDLPGSGTLVFELYDFAGLPETFP